MHTAPYFAGFGFLTVYHAMRVVRLRWKHKVALGDGGVPELERMIRVFGNHSEYVPIGLILLVCLEFVQAPVWFLHLSGTTFLLGRILHAMGLSKTRGTSPGRIIGMILTLTSLLIASTGLLIFSIVFGRV